MRLLLDEDCGAHSLVAALRLAGHDVERVVDAVGLGQGASDGDVFAHAVASNRVLMTKNGSDFFALADGPPPASHPGILVIHYGKDASLSVDAVVRAVSNIAATYPSTECEKLSLNQHVW